MTRRCGFLIVVALLIGGCGAASTPFTKELATADAVYSSGRYHAAALRYEQAAKLAENGRDRDEARYRAAASFRQGGETTEAQARLEAIVRSSPRGERTPRAELDLALMALDSGDATGGNARLEALFRTHPESGLAATALERRLDAVKAEGPRAVLSYLDGLIPALEKTSLGQYLHYDYAESLEAAGQLGEARTRYALIAAKYPFPAGPLWDDALFRAADLDARLGDPRAAIARLESMLVERDRAYVVGSYERGRYPEAQARIAELYRDALHDPKRARAAFEKLYSDFPTSRLRDDAAWQAARLAFRDDDRVGGCRLLGSLARTLPESRYVGCIPRLCPDVGVAPGATCHEYLLRDGD